MSFVRLFRLRVRQTLGRTMRVIAAAALLAGAIDAASLARAAPASHASPSSQAPMRFVRVRSGDLACRPDCPEWISAEGRIVAGTARSLARAVAALHGRRLPIFVNSAGGSVRDAMAMGRLIRAKRLAVVVAHTTIAPCPASAEDCGEARGSAESWGAYCASACTLVLAGGIERYVSPLSLIGVHQMTEVVSKIRVKRLYSVRYFVVAGLKFELSRTFVGERRATATTKRSAKKSVDDDVALYLDEMGVLDPVMELTLATPARDVRWLTAEELATSRLATIWVDDASPIVEDDGASGLRGEPIDARLGAASLFVAKGASPLGRPVAGRPAELEASFAYRRGGAAVFTTLSLRDAAGGAPANAGGAGIYVILDPEGAELGAGKFAAGEPMRLAIPVRSFCRLRRGGRAIVSFGEPMQGKAAETDGAAQPGEPTAAIDLAAAEGARPLFDEACPRIAVASR